MLLRTFARRAAETGRGIDKFSIDIQSSTGFDPASGVGTPPVAAADIARSPATVSGRAFGLQNLIDWIDGVGWPY